MTLQVSLETPWLTLDLGRPMRVLSWAVHNPGLTTASFISWREVRNSDLPQELDPIAWLSEALSERQATDHVCFLTSRNLSAFERVDVQVEDVTATCVATVGLSNAEAVGKRLDRRAQDWGTINVACAVSKPLNDVALIEALSIIAEARTAAVISVDHQLETGLSTGTGTDCSAIAAPQGPEPYAGKHTAVGEAIGASTFRAVRAGAHAWVTNKALGAI